MSFNNAASAQPLRAACPHVDIAAEVRGTTPEGSRCPPGSELLGEMSFDALPEPGEGQRWSTWSAVVKGCHGPKPFPAWLVTTDAAIDTELGVLKTGKEADVFLIDRAVPGADGKKSVLAAKRYRDREHRTFHRDSGYLEGRTVRRSRDQRAMASRSRYGLQMLAGQWAAAEFSALSELWSFDVPVPYPVQVDGTEVLMEFIGHDRQAAPRLAQARASKSQLRDYFGQVADAMRMLAAIGQAHGDLSAYNLLVDGDRIVLIDLPQVVDVVANPNGMEFLRRDCLNICNWFTSRGVARETDELFGVLAAEVFSH